MLPLESPEPSPPAGCRGGEETRSRSVPLGAGERSPTIGHVVRAARHLLPPLIAGGGRDGTGGTGDGLGGSVPSRLSQGGCQTRAKLIARRSFISSSYAGCLRDFYFFLMPPHAFPPRTPFPGHQRPGAAAEERPHGCR